MQSKVTYSRRQAGCLPLCAEVATKPAGLVATRVAAMLSRVQHS